MKLMKKIIITSLCISLCLLTACTPKTPAIEEKFKSEFYEVTEITDSLLTMYDIEPLDIKRGIVADKGDEEFTNRALVVWFKDSAKAKETYGKLKKDEKIRAIRKGDMVAFGNREALDII